jgi:hypothetical protein
MGTGGRGLDGPSTDGGLFAVLTGRLGALGFLTLSVVLAIALAVSLAAASRERAGLRARISEITQQNARSQAVWKAQLSACQAATSPRPMLQTGGPTRGDEAAQRLLAQGPEGIDVCARMESADQAVLSTLK